jgi:hypothetical protein
MTVYLVNLILILLFAGIFLWDRPSMFSKKVFCVLVTTQWVILSGLRHISIGTDTYSYKVNSFDVILYSSWESICSDFIAGIFMGADIKDPGYKIFEKIVQLFTRDYQVYLIIIALIFTVSLGRWIYQNSSDPSMSFLIYSCLFYSFFALTGHRQTIATALVVLIGYQFIEQRKFWPFFALCGLAFPVHKSVICFLPFYFIANQKITPKYLVLISVMVSVLFIFRNQIMIFLGIITGYDSYIEQFEGAGTWTFTTVLLIMTVVTIWRLNVMLKDNLRITHCVNALLMAWVFVPLTFVDPSAMRVVQYYSLFILLLVPEIIKSFARQERSLVYYVAAMLLILLLVKNNPRYLFFWQG